jgi:hypothetical protein
MYWPFASSRDLQDRTAAEGLRSAPEREGRDAPDPYRGAPLGVECAWPETNLHEDLSSARH